MAKVFVGLALIQSGIPSSYSCKKVGGRAPGLWPQERGCKGQSSYFTGGREALPCGNGERGERGRKREERRERELKQQQKRGSSSLPLMAPGSVFRVRLSSNAGREREREIEAISFAAAFVGGKRPSLLCNRAIRRRDVCTLARPNRKQKGAAQGCRDLLNPTFTQGLLLRGAKIARFLPLP